MTEGILVPIRYPLFSDAAAITYNRRIISAPTMDLYNEAVKSGFPQINSILFFPSGQIRLEHFHEAFFPGLADFQLAAVGQGGGIAAHAPHMLQIHQIAVVALGKALSGKLLGQGGHGAVLAVFSFRGVVFGI